MERVVITGMGILCSIGNNLQEVKESLLTGRSGMRPIPPARFSTDQPVYRNQRGCVLDQALYEELQAKDDTILAELSKRVITEALHDAQLDVASVVSNSDNTVGLCLATSVCGSYPFMKWMKSRLSEDSPEDDDLLLMTAPTIAGDIAKHFRINGPLSTISTACAAGTNSIGRGYDTVAKRQADYVIAGGVDVFTELTFSGFNILQALSTGDCAPFDEHRDGLNLGDGGAFVVLESLSSARARNARIYAEIKGYAVLNEAYHPTAPCPDGRFALQAMQSALAFGGILPEEVDYINAHGTATLANDAMEVNAIKNLVAGRAVYVSSTKSMTGHTLGAAGSVELVMTALGMSDGFIPPSINITQPMETLEDNMHIVKDRALSQPFSTALSNSFGFAGNMASIALQKISF